MKPVPVRFKRMRIQQHTAIPDKFSSAESSRQLKTRSPQLETRRQVTGLCVISCKVNKCSSAKERPNKQMVK
jgi:hypothetical protein